jgi:hypothetical protein
MLLLFAVLATVTVRGGEAGAATMSQKIREKIMESVPAPPAAKQPASPKESGDGGDAMVVMSPLIVSEYRRRQELDEAMARARQKQGEEKFSMTKGGTAYRKGRMELGGWWEPGVGWKFMKFSW